MSNSCLCLFTISLLADGAKDIDEQKILRQIMLLKQINARTEPSCRPSCLWTVIDSLQGYNMIVWPSDLGNVSASKHNITQSRLKNPWRNHISDSSNRMTLRRTPVMVVKSPRDAGWAQGTVPGAVTHPTMSRGESSLHTLYIIYIYLHFSHLVDAFMQSDLQMRTIEAIKTNNRSTTCKYNDKSQLD